jgi:NADH-quinone oxidoreductase subunit G
MPSITIDGKVCEFEQGQTILQVANAHGIKIPQYCYHDSMSIPASCRICLAEVWAPNPRNDGKLEAIPKLLPTCQSQAADGQVIYSDSPKAVANQKAVMEYLLINHPLDCAVCDQAGECDLQDYSYEYGRGVSRFEETKVKQPKKDVGPNVLLYADRCIMCTRCVRFTREVTGTGELIVEGRGNEEQIDTFPGKALDNPLASNVIDLCPVGALLDKDFLFEKRVWDLTPVPSIDPITSSGDNLYVDVADDRIYRLRPRENMDVNKWWITDEVRYGWKFVHDENRIAQPIRRRGEDLVTTEWPRAIAQAVQEIRKNLDGGKRLALMVSPMLSCEDAGALAMAALALDPQAVFGVGPVPTSGEDQVYPPGVAENDPKRFVIRAEKAPNARGARRVLEALAPGEVHNFNGFVDQLEGCGAAIIAGGYPSEWATPDLDKCLAREDLCVVLIDVLMSSLARHAEVVLPGASWAEKAGVFENVDHRLQAFEQAIRPVGEARSEGQIGLDLLAEAMDEDRTVFNAATLRTRLAEQSEALRLLETDVRFPARPELRDPDMQLVEL